VFAQYTVSICNREAIQKEFQQAKIPTAVHYPVPLHQQPAYRMQGAGSLNKAESLALRVMSLPMGPDLSEADQDRIVSVLRRAVA